MTYTQEEDDELLPPYSRNDQPNHMSDSWDLPAYGQVSATNTQDPSPARPIATELSRPLMRPNAKARKGKNRCKAFMILVVVCAFIVIVSLAVVLSKRSPQPGTSAGQGEQNSTNDLLSRATHLLTDRFAGDTFFDNFYFYTDTSNETYTNQLASDTMAHENHMIATEADQTSSINVQEQISVRLVSKKSWSAGIFAFEIGQVPRSCNYVSSIRLASSASASPDTEIIIYERQGISTYWRVGYRAQSNTTCGTNTTMSQDINQNDSSSQDCHNRSFTVQPPVCSSNFSSSDVIYNLDVIAHFDKDTMEMTVYLLTDSRSSITKDRLWQIDVGAIDIGRDSWDASKWMMYPTYKVTIHPGCSSQDQFRDLKLVIDTNTCGDYGYYLGFSHIFEDGAWCERECALTDPSYSPGHSDKWNFKRISILPPV